MQVLRPAEGRGSQEFRHFLRPHPTSGAAWRTNHLFAPLYLGPTQVLKPTSALRHSVARPFLGNVPRVVGPGGALSEHFVRTTIGDPEISREGSQKKCVHVLLMFIYNEHR